MPWRSQGQLNSTTCASKHSPYMHWQGLVCFLTQCGGITSNPLIPFPPTTTTTTQRITHLKQTGSNSPLPPLLSFLPSSSSFPLCYGGVWSLKTFDLDLCATLCGRLSLGTLIITLHELPLHSHSDLNLPMSQSLSLYWDAVFLNECIYRSCVLMPGYN